jgi:regulator of nucleoside diphosphate kinase
MAEASLARATAQRPPIILSEHDHGILVGLALRGAGRHSPAATLLLEETDRADIVPADGLPSDAVALNSMVVFTDEATGVTRRVQLVMPAEADIGQGRVSILSLVGAGLIGLRPGQSIDWPVQQGGLRRLRVVSVQRA